MRSKEIVVGEHYAWARWPRGRNAYTQRVTVLETGVEREVGPYYRRTTRRDGVRVEFAHADRDSTVVPAEQIVRTWAEESSLRAAAEAQAAEDSKREREDLIAITRARAILALLGFKEYNDNDERRSYADYFGERLEFSGKAILNLLEMLDAPDDFKVTRRGQKLYVNGIEILDEFHDDAAQIRKEVLA